MRFQIPQFIEVEDRIFGPLTIKQFIYLAGGAALGFIIYRLVYLPIAIFLIAGAVGLALALAFYQINNKPLIFLIQNAFSYYISDKLYLWKKKDRELQQRDSVLVKPSTQGSIYVPKLSKSKLSDLSWSLDIKESLNPVTRNEDRD